MKSKITLLIAAALCVSAAANAQWAEIAVNDPQGDLTGGTTGVDVKNAHYQLSADKKDITFRFQLHTAMTSWKDAGFILNIDDDKDSLTGDAPFGPNRSLKADRAIICINNGSAWNVLLNTANPPGSTPISSSVTIATPDPKTITIKIPVSKVDANSDTKFKTIIEAALGVTSSSVYDAVPSTGYASVDLSKPINPTDINSTVKNGMTLNVYPNPANDAVHFVSDVALEGSIHVYNLSGAEVASAAIQGTTQTISTRELASGTYIYSIVSDKKELVAAGKLQVQ